MHITRRFLFTVLFAVLLSPVAWAEDPAAVEQLAATGSCPDCALEGANLSGQSLVGVILTGAQLYGTNFEGCDLTNADMTGANLGKATLQGSVLIGANLSGADLTGAIMGLVDPNGTAVDAVVTDATTTCPDGQAGPCNF